MRAYTRAAQSYGSVQLVTGVATADNVQLIQMLFDGLSESLATARGHIQNDNIEGKSKALARAGRIVVGLLPWRQAYQFSRIEPYGFFIVMALALTGVVNHLWLDPVMNTTFGLIELILKSLT